MQSIYDLTWDALEKLECLVSHFQEDHDEEAQNLVKDLQDLETCIQKIQRIDTFGRY